eukprot:m.372897 g.372897  ORF g.372897 m.372897 type:complete len:57 (+) comp64878_c0_seq1:38-208(+)
MGVYECLCLRVSVSCIRVRERVGDRVPHSLGVSASLSANNNSTLLHCVSMKQRPPF